MEIAKREVRTAADYARLEQSIRNYASECRGKEQRYIRYFDRFMVDWEDWVKPEASDTDEAGYDWERVFGRKS